jgi:hypothetical protein
MTTPTQTPSQTPSPACPRALIDAHFRARISPEDERAMRLHLAGCSRCRAYYQRHLVLAEIDPGAKSAEARIAVGLGLSFPRRAARMAPLSWAAFAVAAALLLVLPLRHRATGEFTARGATAEAAEPQLFVYRMRPLERLSPPQATIHTRDDLAFAYVNPSGLRHLLVFGVDEHNHVYWYYPAWTRESENPRAIEIAGGADVRELPEAISHPLDGRSLTIFAIFTDDEPSVRAVEELIAKRGSQADPLPLPNAHEQRQYFTVEP